jgi:hypothetical protein
MNGAISWLKLQWHIAESIPRTRKMGFRNLDGISSLPPGKRGLEASQVMRWCGIWLGALARLGWDDTCLRRSMVFTRVLRLQGYDAQVVLGARKTSSGLEGHSWVELEGEVVSLPGEGFEAVWRHDDGDGKESEENLPHDA